MKYQIVDAHTQQVYATYDDKEAAEKKVDSLTHYFGYKNQFQLLEITPLERKTDKQVCDIDACYKYVVSDNYPLCEKHTQYQEQTYKELNSVLLYMEKGQRIKIPFHSNHMCFMFYREPDFSKDPNHNYYVATTPVWLVVQDPHWDVTAERFYARGVLFARAASWNARIPIINHVFEWKRLSRALEDSHPTQQVFVPAGLQHVLTYGDEIVVRTEGSNKGTSGDGWGWIIKKSDISTIAPTTTSMPPLKRSL